MNIKPLFQKRKTVIALILFIILSLPNTIFAMQSEPPFYYILIYGAGSEVTVSYTDNGTLRQAEESKTAWETMYIIPGKEEYCQITIQAGSKTYSYKLDAFLGFHIDGYFIDVKSDTITYSKPIIRSIILVTLRTGITFALGMGVLYLFGSRKRRTFLIYALSALIFLMPLNIFIDSSSGLQGNIGTAMGTVLGIFLILFASLIVYPLTLRELELRKRVHFALSFALSVFLSIRILLYALPI